MTRTKSTPDTNDEIAALREATRAAHEALKDLRAERRAVERLAEKVNDLVSSAVESLIETQVAAQLEVLGRVTEKAMRDSVAKVEREFGRLAAIYLGRKDDGNTLEELTQRAAEARTHPPGTAQSIKETPR